MATLDQLRSLFPDADSDADVIRRAAKDFGIDAAEIASEVGYKVPKGGLTSQQFSSSLDRYQAGLYGVGEEIAKGVGLTGVNKYLKAQRQENELQADIASERARELGAVDEWKNVHGVGDFGSYAKGLAIQSLPYAAEAIAGGALARGAMTGTRAALAAAETAGDVAAATKAKRALNIGSEVGGVAASYPSAVGDVLSNQREQSPTGETRGGVAAALGIPYAALNAVGVESALMRGNLFKNSVNLLDRGTGLTGAAARTAATAAGVGFKEGVSETGQEMLNQIGRMAVDKNEQFFSDAAQERFKESFIGGAALGGLAGGALGGWRRSGNEVSQAISSGDQTNPPITTTQFTPPTPPLPTNVMAGLTGRGADPLAGRSKLVGQEPIPPAPPTPPAVSGGTTDVAQAQQQAQIESQQIKQAQAQQAKREQIYTDFGIADPLNPTRGNLFGKPLYGNSVPAVADALAVATQKMTPFQMELAQAVNKANVETGGKLLNFQFNALDPAKSVQRALEAINKVAASFQIGHVSTVEEAAQILNEQSNTLKGTKLEQINAIHQALTGEDTSGFIAAQQSKAEKGAKNGKLQLQTTTGVGEVPVQGGTNEAGGAGAGPVRPTQVESLGAGGVGEGSLGLQTRQLSGEGIRTGTDAGTGVSNGQPTQNAQVGAQNVQTTTNQVGGGQVSGQQQQTTTPTMGEQPVRNGPRIYATPPQYYATDLSHIQGKRRIEIILDLLNKALAPKVTRKNVAQSQERVEMLRLALIEQFESKDIAKLVGMSESAVQKQLERLGVNFDREKGQWLVTDPAFAVTLVETATAYRSDEFPDGIGEQELAALYSTKYTDEDTTDNQLESDLVGEETGAKGAKLQEELGTKEKPETQSMGVIAEAGGSQSAVDTSGDAFFAKIGKLQAQLDLASDADKPSIQKQIDDAWTAYGKEQTVRGKRGEIEVKPASERQAEEGEEDAVQEPSAEEVPVRKRTGGGKKVGEGNAKGGKAAGAPKSEKETKPTETKQEVKTPEEQWAALAEQFPQMPPYESLDKDEKIRWDDLASRGVANLAAANSILTTTVKAGPTEAPSVTGNVETIKPQVEKLTDGQIARLEKHYGLKRNTKEFFAKVGEDVVTYATKGAEAVSAAIRDIIRLIYTGVLTVAVVFNPAFISAATVVPVVPVTERVATITQEVQAEVPANAAARMSDSAKEVYRTLYPAIKDKLIQNDKLMVVVDKPNARLFIFNPDGSLLLDKKVLLGAAVGDYYKGNNDIKANRITPAGLFTMGLRDATRSAGEARTAGDYDFKKVFVLDKAIDGEYSVTLFHSVWTHEADGPQRLKALQNENAADSRYSFGCINVDKSTYGDLVKNHLAQMDGAALFIVPDNPQATAEFLKGETAQNKSGKDALTRTLFTPKTTTTNVRVVTPNATKVSEVERTVAGKEEERLASKSKSFYDVNELSDDFDGVNVAVTQLEDMGIGHAMDYVSDWETINDPSKDAINGEIVSRGGRYKIVLNEAKLTSSDHAAETVTHEVGHAVDMAPHGGIYSSQPEMSVVVKDGKITPVGAVAREMYNLYNTDKGWAEYLEYPFDTTKFKELNNHVVVEGELFAQIFSVYVNPKGRAKLEQVAPQTAAFMAEVIKHVQSTRSLQIQTAPTQAARSLAFKNRNTSGGSQTSVSPIQRRRETERLASRSASFSEGVDNYLPPIVAKPAKSVVTNIATAARNGLLSAGITEDVVGMASKYMRSAKDYLAAQYARQKTRLDFEMRIERILEDFDKLPKELQGTGANSVNRYILDSTMQRKWGYYPGEHRIGTQLFEPDPDLEARFNAFPPEAQQLIQDVFEHGYTALEMKKTAVSKAVEREFAEREKAAIGDIDALEDLQKERKAMVAKLSRLQNIDFTVPYAYLGRYGDYIVVAKSKEFKHWQERAALNDFDVKQARAWLSDNVSNPDHYVVQFAETQGEADQLAAELIATGKFDMDGTEAGPKEASASYIGDDLHLAVSRARNLANRQKGEGSEELDKLLGDLYLLTAAENSARKSEIARKYVYGANENMMRNLATSGRADAHFLSTMEHNDAITDSLEKMRDEARRNYRDAMPLYNELYTRHANSLDYKQPALLSQALTQATSLWFLSTSPAFYLQQILQTGVLSLPYMAGRLGYFRSARAIKTAYSDVSKLIKGLSIGEHVDFSNAPADVRTMLQTLVGMGKIDIGIDSDARSRAGEQGVVGKVVRKLQGVNNRIETINRATAAIAAYRGYLQRFGSSNTDAATKFAAEVVSNSHGSYDGFNTPRILTSDVGRVLGQFKRFQIIQLSMLGKLIHSSFKGASAEEKMVARRALAFITGHMAVLGGALGVPFVQQLGNILVKIFGEEDEPDDLEYKLRQAIGDKALADLLLNGVPAAMGVNLGGKLGMGNVASILPFTDVDLSSRSGYEKVMVGMMGPFFGGLAPKFIDGAGMISKGEYYKGLELLMPNGIGNAMKGLRYANEGITMRSGDVVMKPEEISLVDAAFQAVGLPTTTITSRQYVQRTKVEFDKFYEDRTAEIKNDYVKANREGDSEGMAEARKEWEDLQTSRRRNGYKIQPMSELFKAPVAARKRETSVVSGVETTKANKQFVANII